MGADDSILVLNCGSSSVKFAVGGVDAARAAAASAAGGFAPTVARVRGQVSDLGGPSGSAKLTWLPGDSAESASSRLLPYAATRMRSIICSAHSTGRRRCVAR
ncbi:MAG: hypothetical protein ACKODG_06025 [Betaproteobacteria bacterium]